MSVLHFTHNAEIDAALARTPQRGTFVGPATIDSGDGTTGPVTQSSRDAISHPSPVSRFAVTCVAIAEVQDRYDAQETIGRALLDAPVRSVVILDVEPRTTAMELHRDPAPQAFHALNNAAQILRGEFIETQDLDRARELVGQATEQLGELYLALIRAQRHVKELRETRVFLDMAPAERRALTASGGK